MGAAKVFYNQERVPRVKNRLRITVVMCVYTSEIKDGSEITKLFSFFLFQARLAFVIASFI